MGINLPFYEKIQNPQKSTFFHSVTPSRKTKNHKSDHETPFYRDLLHDLESLHYHFGC